MWRHVSRLAVLFLILTLHTSYIRRQPGRQVYLDDLLGQILAWKSGKPPRTGRLAVFEGKHERALRAISVVD